MNIKHAHKYPKKLLIECTLNALKGLIECPLDALKGLIGCVPRDLSPQGRAAPCRAPIRGYPRESLLAPMVPNSTHKTAENQLGLRNRWISMGANRDSPILLTLYGSTYILLTDGMWISLKSCAGCVDKYSMTSHNTTTDSTLIPLPKGEIPVRWSGRKTAYKYLISLRFYDFRIPFTNRILRVEVFSEFP